MDNRGLHIQTSGRVVSGFAISVNELPGKMTKEGRGCGFSASRTFSESTTPLARISADFQC